MEYKKETEKFSFGIGTEKVAGKGSLKDVRGETAELIKIIAPLAVTAGAGLLKIVYKNHRRKK